MITGSREQGAQRRGVGGGAGDAAVPTYIPPPDDLPAGQGARERQDTASDRRRRAAVRRNESLAFTAHLGAEPTLTRPVAPAPGAPDPAPERARIERELGIDELASSLAKFGTPPLARPAAHTDREALERRLLGDLPADVSRWYGSARRSLRNQIRAQAAPQAQAEDERLAAEYERVQRDLEERSSQLRELRARAARKVEEWVAEQTRQGEAARAEQQAALDREWQLQLDADPDHVTATLRAAVDDFATVLGCLQGVVVAIVACPHRDEVIAARGLAYGSAGPAVARTRSQTHRNRLYLAAIASRILATVGRVLSTAPAVDAVTCVAVRASDATAFPCEPIYGGTFWRAYAERLAREGRWTAHPDTLIEILKEAERVELELNDTTDEVTALELDDDPGRRAVVQRMDPRVRADAGAARTSDQNAVSLFLRDRGVIEHNPGDERSASKLTHLQSDTEMSHLQSDKDGAVHRPSGDTDVTPGETLREPTSGEPQPPQQPASVGESHPPHEQSANDETTSRDESSRQTLEPRRDPLRDALHDADGSVRRAAVLGISKRNDPNDTPLLLEALADQDRIVRLEAVYALKDRLSPDMRHDVLLEASGDGDEIDRRKAIEALADLADERDTPVLLRALRDPDDGIRLQAIYAIEHRLTPDMRDALIAACSDGNARVRQKAVASVAELADERDTPLLLKALQDSDASVRFEAIHALEGSSALGSPEQLREPLAIAMKSDDPVVRHAAVKLLVRAEQR